LQLRLGDARHHLARRVGALFPRAGRIGAGDGDQQQGGGQRARQGSDRSHRRLSWGHVLEGRKEYTIHILQMSRIIY